MMAPQDPRPLPEETPKPTELAAGELAAEMVRESEASFELSPVLQQRLLAIGQRQLESQRQLDAKQAARSERSRGWARAGWVVAIAASLAWLLLPNPLRLPVSADLTAAAPSGAELYASLSRTPNVVRVAWGTTQDPAGRGATGEVLWDSTAQRGVMRFVGLTPNDARTAQYQLWIVDAERDARYPVDGGVFDVTSEGEVLVPVTARIPVGRPTLFAVTLERPGGVVVSTRERLVLAAAVGG